eukprot:TRINITY_DN236_c0_g3_i3.p1 TRINITY_DN236_c0_g3~~TRINITY_DN236_c0_g3_i3.p1  ORF type:complete len:309 (-),score=50.16 TRINITY_DN236_c0_g3_i3:66-992(-)
MIPLGTSWPLLEKIAKDPIKEVSGSILAEDPQRISRMEDKKKYLELIFKVAESEDLDTRKAAIYALSKWADGFEEIISTKMVPKVLNLEANTEWRAAASTLSKVCCDGLFTEKWLDIFNTLLKAEVKPEENAGELRDLPASQRIITFACYLRSLSTRHQLSAVNELVIKTLLSDQSKYLTAARYAFHCDTLETIEHHEKLIRQFAGYFEDHPLLLTEFSKIISAHLPRSSEEKSKLAVKLAMKDGKLVEQSSLRFIAFRILLVGRKAIRRGAPSPLTEEERTFVRLLRDDAIPSLASMAKAFFTAKEV